LPWVLSTLRLLCYLNQKLSVPSVCIASPCPTGSQDNRGDTGIHALLHDSLDCIV
jgi:hypothetical protein